MTDEQVLDHRQLAGQAEVLEDEGQPGVAEPAQGDRQRHRLVVHAQLAAGFGLVVAGQDLDQRRLARAVLTQQRDDLSKSDVEVDAAQGPLAGEALGEAPR